MATAILRAIDKVDPFPGRPGLTIVTLLPEADRPVASLVSARLEDGSARYAPGDVAVLLEEGSILPEWLLRKMDFWDAAKAKGSLAGGRGNRLKGRTFKNDEGFAVESRGALYGDLSADATGDGSHGVVGEGGAVLSARVGDDLAAALGIS